MWINLSIIENYYTSNTYGMLNNDIHSIFGYTSNFFYRKLNSYLWQEINLNQTTNITNLLNGAMNKLSIFEQGVIYRAIAVDPADIDNFILQHQVNDEKIWKGFSSCGSSKDAAFANDPEMNVIFKITHIDAKDISDLADGIHFRDKPPHELFD